MVVAPGRNEGRGGPVALRQLKPKHVAIEPEGAVEVGDLEMDMTDAHAGSNSCHLVSAGAPARRLTRTFVIRRRSTSRTSTARSSTSNVSPTYGIRPRYDRRYP